MPFPTVLSGPRSTGAHSRMGRSLLQLQLRVDQAQHSHSPHFLSSATRWRRELLNEHPEISDQLSAIAVAFFDHETAAADERGRNSSPGAIQ